MWEQLVKTLENTTHSVLIEQITYVFFAVQNLTSQTFCFAFLSIVCDIGAIYYSYFLDFRSFESVIGPKNGSKLPKLAISWP